MKQSFTKFWSQDKTKFVLIEKQVSDIPKTHTIIENNVTASDLVVAVDNVYHKHQKSINSKDSKHHEKIEKQLEALARKEKKKKSENSEEEFLGFYGTLSGEFYEGLSIFQSLQSYIWHWQRFLCLAYIWKVQLVNLLNNSELLLKQEQSAYMNSLDLLFLNKSNYQ